MCVAETGDNVRIMRATISQAWRSWKSSKTVALLAAVALAVGIGSTTAIYTVVNGVMQATTKRRLISARVT